MVPCKSRKSESFEVRRLKRELGGVQVRKPLPAAAVPVPSAPLGSRRALRVAWG